MRLICPNCGAQYEVEDNVIPDEGRDVQCSNCGHTWFQRPAHLDQALAEELDQQVDEEPPGKGSEHEKTEETAETRPGRERRGLDPEVADVLREEASREAAARRGESTALETQPDLGLDDQGDGSGGSSAAARARMARLRGADDASPEAAAALAAASRRDLLPDIEEINSSLRASQDRDEAAANVMTDPAPEPEPTQKPEKHRGGFSRGFTMILLLAVLAVMVYVLAPRIIELVPQSEPYLVKYVAFANEMREQASEGMTVAIAKIKELIASVTGG